MNTPAAGDCAYSDYVICTDDAENLPGGDPVVREMMAEMFSQMVGVFGSVVPAFRIVVMKQEASALNPEYWVWRWVVEERSYNGRGQDANKE